MKQKSTNLIIIIRGLLLTLSLAMVWFMRGVLEWSVFVFGAILIWLSYETAVRLFREQYLRRIKYGDYFRYWGIITATLGGLLLIIPLLNFGSLNLQRLYAALLIMAITAYLPIILGEFLAALYKMTRQRETLHLLKSIVPFHRLFIKMWENVDLREKYQLLFLEPDARAYPSTLQPLIELWLMIGEITPITVIRKHNRFQYKFLKLEDESQEKILEVERFNLTAEAMTITVQTAGDLIAENLLTGKARAKLIEYFALQQKPIKSISYNPTSRQIVIQFFMAGESMPPSILEIAQKLELGFTELEIKNSLNAYPRFEGFEIIDQEQQHGTSSSLIYSVKLTYKLPSGLSTEMITAQKVESLASYIRRPLYQHRLRPYDETMELYVELAVRNLSKLRFEDFPAAEGLRIALGFDLRYRTPVFINFDQAEVKEGDPGFTPHLLIAGATASGKSSFIKFMIMQLLRTHTPESLRFFMVDPKVVTFKIFHKLPHLYAPIVSDADKFQVILSGIVDEVEKRYRILAECDVENLYQLQSHFPEKAKLMPRILVIVDEFADIIDSHAWKVREEIVLTLKKLGQKARAAGVHLILITQRATSTNIDSEVKANISGRISFKVASESDSQVIIESPVAADLKNPGEGFARLGDSDELVHFQAPYVSDEQLKEIMHKYEGLPQEFLDKTLTEEILKKPLSSEEVKLSMLPATQFPVIPIGVNLDSHKPIFLVLSRPAVKYSLEPTPHFIVAGATNSGKSQFAKLLIQRLALSADPKLVRLILVDPKAVTFVPYKKLPHLACPLVTKHNQLLPLVKEMLKIIEERYDLFASVEVENIEEYRAKTGQDLASYILIIDEFADLLDYYDYKERDEIEKILKRFGQMARAAGVHLILITQRATSQNISGEIRTNFSGRLAFRMNSEADSFYILEESGAEALDSAGHFLLKKAHYPLERGYSPLLSEEEIHATVEKMQEKYGQTHYEERLQKALEAAEKSKEKPSTDW